MDHEQNHAKPVETASDTSQIDQRLPYVAPMLDSATGRLAALLGSACGGDNCGLGDPSTCKL